MLFRKEMRRYYGKCYYFGCNQKNEELTKANQLKEDAKIAANVAKTATNLAKKLEVDAGIPKEALIFQSIYHSTRNCNKKNKNNKRSVNQTLRNSKRIRQFIKTKNQSDELFFSLKAKATQNNKEITNTEKKNNAISTEINAIKMKKNNFAGKRPY